MDEIKHSLKQQFLLLMENEVLLTWYTPKDLWMRFEEQSQTIKWQTYSLIRELEKSGYIRKKYDESGNLYYTETDKLTEFRIIHCKEKAVRILTEKLKLIELEKKEKVMEIQLTKELSKQLPEINFCLKNHIKNNEDILIMLDYKKNIIFKIINNIESCIY
ncbi:hypothetical protein ABTQ09_15535 [Acinetobacter baumannii]|uniref:hypothetical protein n=2 Tax=Acinetobacter baumannii TaxID=470 RepID=UPI00056E24E1|nr:hypothetical protein [Acinetobacter baumannii]AMN01602.1 hypothetical protein AZE33_10470 [Acinetobacter baumannii]MDB0262122.1 hypothetical protein [Acinetobacter baumannii]MDB0305747.1 hypothetical protein [Acinetobacter baumannii]MVO49862.1 hypothetical protein [Acinetobacter baumannii]OID15458.1 hypothetical protein A7L28_00325 [Acinetobacter baumannii]